MERREVRKMSGKKGRNVTLFKQFVKRHPKLIIEVRQGKMTWQQLYEEWYLLGEDDPSWKKYRSQSHSETDKNTNSQTTDENHVPEVIKQIMNYIKKMDMDQVQQFLGQINDALENFQKFLEENYKANPHETTGYRTKQRNFKNPFSFRKD